MHGGRMRHLPADLPEKGHQPYFGGKGQVTVLNVEKQDILMVGVGGQGIVLASDILGDVALAMGLDVKKTDTLGICLLYTSDAADE